MSAQLAPYNVSLHAESPVFTYLPSRGGDPNTTWNISSIQAVYAPQGGGGTVTNPSDTTVFVRTQYSDATMTIPFFGSAIYLCLAAGGSNYTLTVDGTRVQRVEADASVQPACTAYAAAGVDTLLIADGLDSETHNAVLHVLADPDHEFRFFGATVTMGVTTGGRTVDDSTVIDDRDPTWFMALDFKRALTWNQSTPNGAAYAGTQSFTCSYDPQGRATSSYSFTGAGGLVLYGILWDAIRVFSVVLDGVTTKINAINVGPNLQVVLFFAGGLDPTMQHMLTLSDYNTDFPTCPGRLCCMSLDAITLLKPGVDNLPTASLSSSSNEVPTPTVPANVLETESSKNVGVITGGVGGCLLAVALIAFAIIFFRRRYRPKIRANIPARPVYINNRLSAGRTSIAPAFTAPPTFYESTFQEGLSSREPSESGLSRKTSMDSFI